MIIFLFEARSVRFELSSEEEIANISAPGLSQKTKVTLLSQTLKVQENNVSLFFYFWARSRDIGNFFL